MINRATLLQKYDIPAPRYTSYPTVPYWTNNPTTNEWINSLERNLAPKDNNLSIYIHIPFCETRCTFCGCNTSITKNHAVEEPYTEALLAELDLYLAQVPSLKNKKIKELHLGGGSPTYLSESNLEILISNLLKHFPKEDHAEFSVEVDPRRTRISQLEILYKYGFRRISLGVQDFDPEVQRLVNRIQPFSETKYITDGARALGYTSVNFDLIYGLPKQTLASIEQTFELTLSLRPDRIAFYSYAHVPWIKASQRLFTEDDLPEADEKRALYELGRRLLEAAGYIEIGMDHFALAHDTLALASDKATLHRNFMGYSNQKTDVMLGLGVSAISETPDTFFQNEKLEMKYRKSVMDHIIPNFRGHKLDESDQTRRILILDLMTKWNVMVPDNIFSDIKSYLQTMEDDNLITWMDHKLVVTDAGKPFLRIVATAFDEKLRASKPEFPLFSKAI